MISPLIISLKVVVTALAIDIVLGVPLAYWLARRRFVGRTLIEILVALPLVFPPTVTGYFLVVLFGRNGVIGGWMEGVFGWSPLFTWEGGALAAAIVAFPLLVQPAQAAFEGIEKDHWDVASLFGLSGAQTFRLVAIPMAWRGIAAGISLALARALGEFGATLMVAGNIPGRTTTLPVALYSATASGDWGRARTLTLLLTLLVFGFVGCAYFGLWLSRRARERARP